MTLTEKKAQAKAEYKAARAAWLEYMSEAKLERLQDLREQMKNEKWIAFCIAERNCKLLGVII